MKIPRIPSRLSVIDVAIGSMSLVLIARPSVPVAVAFAAGALARALERYFVDLAREYRTTLHKASTAAANASQAASDAKTVSESLEVRLTRLETRASWSDGRSSSGR